MSTIWLRDTDLMDNVAVTALRGTYLFRPHYDRVVRGSTTVLKPDGDVLLIYVQDAIAPDVCRTVLRRVRHLPIAWTDARGYAAGGSAFRRLLTNGKLSQTLRWRRIQSDVVGFLDRHPRNPYCRMTTLTRKHGALRAVLPLAVEANRVFQLFAAEKWGAQRRFIDTVSPAFVLPGTVFTSVTVNRSARTACHTDAHDYRPGLGVMAVLEQGQYDGGELIFPKYRTAVDMRTGGILLADVHEWHGNARFVGHQFRRFSFVFYARERMNHCGSVEDERMRGAREG